MTGDLELHRVSSLEVPTGLLKMTVDQVFDNERGRYTDSGVELEGFNDVARVSHSILL